MCGENNTRATELVLLGFQNVKKIKYFVFGLFLVVYFVIVLGNTLIIFAISASPKLQSPMYFFLGNLSSCELFLTSVILPNLLYVVWKDGGPLSFFGCFAQFYLYASSGSVECLILTIMAFDRYLAICNPLRYSCIMDYKTKNLLVLWAWLSGFMVMSILTIQVCGLLFCGSNAIDHIFCDLAPILHVSSMDTSSIERQALGIAFLLTIVPFTLILLSYVSICVTIIRIPTEDRRQKMFSTCSSHLASVCTYFGTLFSIYLVPPQIRSAKVNKILSLTYIVVTPLLNPFIYSLRNKEMKAFFNYFASMTVK